MSTTLPVDSPTAGNHAASHAQQIPNPPPPPTAGDNQGITGQTVSGLGVVGATPLPYPAPEGALPAVDAPPRGFPECALVLVDHLIGLEARTREKDDPSPPANPSAREILETTFCVGAAATPPWVQAAIAEGDVCYLCQKPFEDADRHDMVRANCACRHPMHCSCMTRQINTGVAEMSNRGGHQPNYTWRCGQCWTPFLGNGLQDAVRAIANIHDVYNEYGKLRGDPSAERRKIEGHEATILPMLRTWQSTSPCVTALGSMLVLLGYCYLQLAARCPREGDLDDVGGQEESLVLLGRCALAWGHFVMGKDVRMGCIGSESVFNSCGRPAGQHLDDEIMHIEVRYLCNVLRYAKLPARRVALENAQTFCARLFLFDPSRFAPPINSASPLWGELELFLIRFLGDPETDLDRLVDVPRDGDVVDPRASSKQGKYGDKLPCTLLVKAFIAAGKYGRVVWGPLLEKLRAHPVGEGTWVDDIMAVPLAPAHGESPVGMSGRRT